MIKSAAPGILLVCVVFAFTGCRKVEEKTARAVPAVEPALVQAEPAPPAPPPISTLYTGTQRAVTIRAEGAEWVVPGDHVDILAVLRDERAGGSVALTIQYDVPVLAVGPCGLSSENEKLASGERFKCKVTLQLELDDAEVAVLGSIEGSLCLTLRNPEEEGGLEERARATIETLMVGERVRALYKRRLRTIQQSPPVLPAGEITRPLSKLLPIMARSITLPAEGARVAQVGDHVDVIATMLDPKYGGRVSTTILQNLVVLTGEPATNPVVSAGRLAPGKVSLMLRQEEAEILYLASHLGQLHLALRSRKIAKDGDRGKGTTMDNLMGPGQE